MQKGGNGSAASFGRWREALEYLKELVDVQLEYKSVLENTTVSKIEEEKRFKELYAKANEMIQQ